MRTLESLGLLKKVCKVRYFPGSELLIPLDWNWYWNYAELSQYEPTTLRAFTEKVKTASPGPAIFLDCGAHIGLVSHYVAQTCANVKSTWSFEPNAALFPILKANCERAAHPSTPVATALSDFTGMARLVIPEGNDDGAYILPDEHGDIAVKRIDDIGLPGGRGVIMKIDVEGSELAILRGAQATLRQAPSFVVLFEAHKEVMERTGIDPMECVRFLNELRPCRWMPSSLPDVELDVDKPFFTQVTGYTKRDVIVWSSDSR